MPKITVLPGNVSAEVAAGEFLYQAGEKAGAQMEGGCFSCNCGTCLVEVVQGAENLAAPSPEELDVLDGWNRDPEQFRLACCTAILKGEVIIRQLY